ncbi:PITRM1 [Mytilus coruscus]|uniref:Presequence protease, mitochondrial n=1 Tax=Mytilus coruscus TaxID=42192 RepID=A0A6J8DXZ1_MYTCO|nr:PITRM1 [Mytilus coruscus]
MHRIIKPGKFARIFAKSQRIHHCRLCSSVQNAVKKYKDGDKIHGYTVKKVVEVPELMLTSVVLHHDKTGAEHLHVARDDSNNAFSVMFRTTPMDSTGVPHILEHTTLCGSRRFPVRDPFFKMLNRSLSTFMNAMTASDWTMYPFSSQNQKDFENLLSVYLDAVFFPQLRELDFSQEGWRLENENPEDKSSPLMFKGVVYNEMKGVFSNKDNIYCQAVENELLPSHTYGVVSGGEPSKITDLTWEHLKNFHASHYHPSNSRFYTYGNFPLEKHLEYINSNYLQKFDKIDIDTKVPNEPRWTEMRRKHITCQPDPMAPDQEKQTTMSVSYLLTDISETFESFTLSIIGALLMDGETSPFYQSLLVPNIGSDFAPMTGYHSDTKDSAFSVGLQGISANDVEKVTQIISDTFDQVVSEGFEQKRIDALLHQIELGQKHQSSNFGVKLTLAISHSWNHDTDPVESLQINKYVEQFRQKLQDDPQFLQNKVKQYFKNNKHYEDKEQIYKKGQTLLQQQMDKEDLSCLPTLHINEIDRKIIEEKTATVTSGKVPVQLCVQPTNGITYLHMMSNMRDVPSDLKPYVPLFCDVITKMGAGSMDYKELSQQIELTTSGLGAGTHVNQHHSDNYSYEQGVEFSSYCLDRNVDKMLDLWTNIFCSISETFESFYIEYYWSFTDGWRKLHVYQSLLVPNIGSDFCTHDRFPSLFIDLFSLIVKGFEQKRIDALLHQIELGQKHQSSNFGVKLTLAISHSWNHDTILLKGLQINKYVEQFRQKLQDDPQFLQNKVKQYFKNNKHCLVSTMSPDEKFEEKRKEEETTRLQKMVEKLTDEDKEQIYKKGQTLLQQQMDKEDLSCLQHYTHQ